MSASKSRNPQKRISNAARSLGKHDAALVDVSSPSGGQPARSNSAELAHSGASSAGDSSSGASDINLGESDTEDTEDTGAGGARSVHVGGKPEGLETGARTGRHGKNTTLGITDELCVDDADDVQVGGSAGTGGTGRLVSEEGQLADMTQVSGQGDPRSARKKVISAKKLAKFREQHARRGIVYMSRVPPHLKPLKLRQMLEKHAEVGRLYMAPVQRPPRAAGGRAKRSGKSFSEAWIEFEDKRLARAVAELLNGQPMGGRRRSKHHDDLWTLKYLPKFKWDHLTEEIAHEKAVREKKLAQELSSAKRERDFYLSKVAQAKKHEAITERKRKRGEDLPDDSGNKQARTYQQREPKRDGEPGAPGHVSQALLSMFAS